GSVRRRPLAPEKWPKSSSGVARRSRRSASCRAVRSTMRPWLFPERTMQVLASGVATRIRDGFSDYHARFAAITRRANPRFEARDVSGMRADLVERIELYDICIDQMQHWLEHVLGEHAQDRALWSRIRDAYAHEVADLL